MNATSAAAGLFALAAPTPIRYEQDAADSGQGLANEEQAAMQVRGPYRGHGNQQSLTMGQGEKSGTWARRHSHRATLRCECSGDVASAAADGARTRLQTSC